ncbi:MAG: Sjogren's syndrome/scleroderma autoantigen 1 family protein [Candidatus Helarchaeota archaeon]
MSEPSKKLDQNNIKRMAELLKDGNTMLDLICPKCGSPLFRLKNQDIYCGNCQRKVVLLKDDQELDTYNKMSLLSETNDILYSKVMTVTNLIKSETDLDEQSRLIKLLYNYLLTIEKLNSIKKI